MDQDDVVTVRSNALVRSTVGLRSVVQILVLVLTWSSLVSVDGVLTEDQEETLVELHNRYRGIIHPPANAMLPLKWDRALKLVAEGYAAKCVWNHNPYLEETGENLFAGTGALDLERALEKWFLEHLDYNYYNNSCADDKMCGHYTQMVWAYTHKVGCAVHVCAQVEGLDWTEPINFLVCNYYPAGNYEGEHPYVEGDWCSQCPENLQRCENNLCVSDTELSPPDDDEDDEDLTVMTEEPTQPVLPPGPEEPDTEEQGLDQNLGRWQEAVVPPPATETTPELPTTAADTEGQETGLGPGPEPESPTEGSTVNTMVLKEEAEMKIHTQPPHEQTPPQTPPPRQQSPPPLRLTPHPRQQTLPQTPPPRHQTPPPENRGQKQNDFVEKGKRDQTRLESKSTVHTASKILIFIWVFLNLV